MIIVYDNIWPSMTKLQGFSRINAKLVESTAYDMSYTGDTCDAHPSITIWLFNISMV